MSGHESTVPGELGDPAAYAVTASEPEGRAGGERANARRLEGLSTIAPSTPAGAPRRRMSHNDVPE
ncbi:glycosyltransferase family 2 protein, partial [Streptomyces sp. KR55]